MGRCRRCGQANPRQAVFCMACGLRLAWSDLRPDARKPATVLFNDVAGSTGLGERLEPEAMRRVLWRYYETVTRACERHGGTVEKFIGDAVMAVFGVPTAQEDHALRAVRAAAELEGALDELNDELERHWGIRLQCRTGVNSGEVVAGDPAGGQALVTGDAVNIAARLEQAAAPGEVLIGAATFRLAGEAIEAEKMEPLEIRGKSERVEVWRLLAVTLTAGQLARRLDSPMLGREQEIELLLEQFEAVSRERVPRLVTLVGPAGIGKSRLVEELRAAVEDRARVLTGTSLPYGEGITFWPLAEIVRQLVAEGHPRAGIVDLLGGERHAELIADRVTQAVGLSEAPGDSRELAWAVRRLLEVLSGDRPVLAVFEDVYWAEPPMLDLIEHVAKQANDAPILIVCLARAELFEQRPGWPREGPNTLTLELQALPTDAVQALIDQLLPAGADPAMRTELVARAGGNPLFVEQMLALVREEGLTAAAVRVPPTIQALLAARLDLLPVSELELVGAASVVGGEFWLDAAVELTGREPARVETMLSELVRKEFLRPEGKGLTGEPGFSFHHGLVREAAYESLTKERRAALHERFGAWMEDNHPDRVAELEAILGYHFEQAYGYRVQMAPPDERARELALRGATRLASAGRRAARGRQDATAAALLERARKLLPEGAAERLDLLPLIAMALEGTANHAKARELYMEALDGALATGRRGIEGRARLGRASTWFVLDPEISAEKIVAEAERAIPLLEEAENDPALVDAWRLIGVARLYEGRASEGQAALERALDRLGPESAPREWNAICFATGMCMLDGPAPLGRAIAFARERLNEARAWGLAAMEADMLHVLGVGEGRMARFDDARAALDASNAISEELGLSYMAQWSRRSLGRMELDAGDARAAEQSLRWSYEILMEMGLKGTLGETAIPLADALFRQGRYDEADQILESVKDEWVSGDVSIEAPRLAIRAKLQAARGWHDHAERAAQRALRLVRKTDWSCLHADVLLCHAEVLRLAGRRREVPSILRDVWQVAWNKGYAVATRDARRQLQELGEEIPEAVSR